ncbi:hypothetical protein PY78_06815 [Lacticaseibacillus rhamnosus]|nr:hypothetical protein PY78_06815 [Lacticaseibacillus rhamnosus]
MDKPKIIVVGASHGGHQSVLELLHRYPDAEITMFEAGDFCFVYVLRDGIILRRSGHRCE